MTITYIIQNSS